jgi:putative multiple sugar transport system permease protein
MLLCILTGGNIDLSVGSVVCFTGGIGAVMMDRGMSAVLAVIVMLAVGLAIGLFQGFWIAYVSVPPFIATLAGMYAFRGLSNVVLNGYSIGVRNVGFLNVFGGGADCYIPDFIGGGKGLNLTCMIAGVVIAALFLILNIKTWITRKVKGYANESMAVELLKTGVIALLIIYIAWKLAQFKGIPSVLLWILAVLLIYNYITQRTAIGRYLYAVGGNRKATELSGVNTKKVFLIAYANMGFLAGLAGILTLARAVQGNPTFGQGYEMDAIAACFIGGASAYGGIGNVYGTVVGAVLLGVINQGMSIMGVSTNYQSVIKGLVLLVAVLVDVVSKKKE